MLSETTRALLARMRFRSTQLARWMRAEHRRNLRSAADCFFDMSNGGLFALCDWLDEAGRSTAYKRSRGLFWAGLAAAVGYLGYGLASRLESLASRLSVCDKDEALVRQASQQLEWVVLRFVLQSEYICAMLGDVLGTSVFQNPRVRFMLSRNLARVIASEYIEKSLADLTVHSVLRQNVFPNDAVFSELRALVVRQLRGEELRNLLRGQTVGFFRSEGFGRLAEDGLADTLRLPPVVNAFVRGVVDETVYRMLESREMARKLDQQLYEVLK